MSPHKLPKLQEEQKASAFWNTITVTTTKLSTEVASHDCFLGINFVWFEILYAIAPFLK